MNPSTPTPSEDDRTARPPSPAATEPSWWATWVAGPDCGATVALDPTIGRWLVGRSTSAAIRCDDPALAAHHAVVEMCPSGAATGWAHGEVPRATVLAAPPPTAHAQRHPRRGVVVLGHSTLALHRSAPPPAVVRPDGMVRRRARPRRPVPVPPQEPAGLIDAPRDAAGDDSAPPALALISSAVALAVAMVMAVVLAQPMFAWFAVSGAVVAVAGWAVQRAWLRRGERRRRAARRERDEQYTAALATHAIALQRHHLATTTTVARAWHTIVEGDAHLWERRHSDDDAMVVSVGALPSHSGHLVADLAAHRRLAVTGPHAPAAARGLVLQLVAQCGPADLRVIAVTDGPAAVGGPPPPPPPAGSQAATTSAVEGIDRLPHGVTCTPDEVADELARLDGESAQHVVVVTDMVEQLAIRTSPLRRALDAQPEVTLMCVHHGPAPLVCTAELSTDAVAQVVWTPDRSAPSERSSGRLTGVGAARWATAIATLGWLVDPEDDTAAHQVPDRVEFEQLVDLDPADIARRWAGTVVATPRTVVGVAADGLVGVDLVRDGPHALVVGTTGSGKSELLRSLVVGLAAHTPPDLLQFVLVDFKGGAAFDACARLPHVVGLVTDLDPSGCERVVRSLRAELRRRETILRAAGVADLAEWSEARANDPNPLAADRGFATDVPRLVVVIDEFAVLAHDLPDVLHSLVDIARRGRSLGVHLVLATQRATGTLSDDIRANTALRLALRLHDPGESRDVVGDESAARLSRRAPGRAVVRLGDDERIVFQSAYSAPVLAAAVEVLASVAVREGRLPRRRPWCDPLPPVIDDDDLAAMGDDPLGLIDDTDAQGRRALRWTPDSGGLLLLGGPRTGLTRALDLLARQLTRQSRTYVRIGADTDEECLHRCLGVAAADPDAVVMIDRLDLVRARLESDGRELHHEMLVHTLVRQRCVVVTASTLASVPGAVLHRLPIRWIAHLTDPFELAGLGGRPDENPPAVPGRIVIVAGPDAGLTAQLARPPSHAADLPLDATTTHGDGHDPSRVGVDLATGDVVGVSCEPGEHLLVTGSRRTGRTTALRALAAAWTVQHPDGVVVHAQGREPIGSLERAWAATAEALENAPTLLVVDDADLIDGDTALHALLETRHPHLTLAVAVDPTGLRGRYGHWTLAIRRHRTGLALLGGDDDGDTWGIVLPRRLPLSPAPGRALVIRRGVVDESLGPRIIAIDAMSESVAHRDDQRRSTRLNDAMPVPSPRAPRAQRR